MKYNMLCYVVFDGCLRVWISLESGDEMKLEVDYAESTSSVVEYWDVDGNAVMDRHKWPVADALAAQRWAAHDPRLRALYDRECFELRDAAAEE